MTKPYDSLYNINIYHEEHGACTCKSKERLVDMSFCSLLNVPFSSPAYQFARCPCFPNPTHFIVRLNTLLCFYHVI